jgi:hypothetical protein
MSAFLGPIHHWLFNKISLHEKLEKDIIDVYKKKYGSEIDQVEAESISRYGNPSTTIPLEAQIDLTNIHQWLQTSIGKAETRLSYILAEVMRKHGSEAFDIALDKYVKQGEQCGASAKAKGNLQTPADVFKSINDYLLDGMPCDRVNVVKESDEKHIVWETTECLHRGFWQQAGADIDSLYKLRFSWIKSYVEGAAPGFSYSHKTGDNIDSLFIHEIKKSS